MSDHHMNADPGRYGVVGPEAVAVLTRGAETWQFFAFVFAAAVTLALALLDEIPPTTLRIIGKLVAFLGLAYLLLANVRVRNWLAGLLQEFKKETIQ